jgi:pyrroline-5-carboxylate reductase
MAKQSLMGAATLLQQPGADAVRLRAAVSSPGGVTIAGIRALEERGVRAALMAAAEAGRDRAGELGRHA